MIQAIAICAQTNQDSILVDQGLEKLNLWLEGYKLDSVESRLESIETLITHLYTEPSRPIIELMLIKSKYQQILGNYEEASIYASSSVRQSTRLNDTVELLRLYNGLARASYFLRKYEMTDSLCQLSLDLHQAMATEEDEKNR